MDDSGRLFEQVRDGTLAAGAGGQLSSMQSVQNLEAVINEGLRLALLEENPDDSLNVLLKHLGKALNGERTYIFEQNESGGDDNTYEWVADGVEPEKENLQNLPPEVCASWYRNFSGGRHIVIEKLENMKQIYLSPTVLWEQTLHSPYPFQTHRQVCCVAFPQPSRE